MAEQNYLGQYSVSLRELTEHMGGLHVGTLRDLKKKHTGHKLALGDVGNLALGTIGKLTLKVLDLAKDLYSLVLTGERRARNVLPELHVTAEHAHNVQEEVLIHFNGKGLDRPRTPFGFKAAIANYFIQICRVQRNQIIPVARSASVTMLMNRDAIRHGIDPQWEPMRFKTYRLCGAIIGDTSSAFGSNSNHHCPLLIQVWDRSNFDGDNHNLIGFARVTLAELRSGTINRIELKDPSQSAKRGYENSGELIVEKASLLTSFSFLHYMNLGGFSVQVCLAVDLSDSNYPAKNPEQHDAGIRPPVSLHAPGTRGKPNRYASAIRSSCEILGRYDKGNAFPTVGFGAEAWGHFADGSTVAMRVAESMGIDAPLQTLHPAGRVFPLSFGAETIENTGKVEGSYIDNVVEAYKHAVDGLNGAEPTHLAPVIRWAHEKAKEGKEEDKDHPPFVICVVFTDGWIDDMTETVDALVEASFDPVGVILVGIGKGKREKKLDADGVEGTPSGGDKKGKQGKQAGKQAGDSLDAEEEDVEFALCKRLLDRELRSVVSGKTVARPTCHFVAYDKFQTLPAMEFHRALLTLLPKMFLSWVEKAGLSLDEEHDSEDGDAASSPLGAHSVVSGGTFRPRGGANLKANSAAGSAAPSRANSAADDSFGSTGTDTSGAMSNSRASLSSARRSSDGDMLHDTMMLMNGPPAATLRGPSGPMPPSPTGANRRSVSLPPTDLPSARRKRASWAQQDDFSAMSDPDPSGGGLAVCGSAGRTTQSRADAGVAALWHAAPAVPAPCVRRSSTEGWSSPGREQPAEPSAVPYERLDSGQGYSPPGPLPATLSPAPPTSTSSAVTSVRRVNPYGPAASRMSSQRRDRPLPPRRRPVTTPPSEASSEVVHAPAPAGRGLAVGGPGRRGPVWPVATHETSVAERRGGEEEQALSGGSVGHSSGSNGHETDSARAPASIADKDMLLLAAEALEARKAAAVAREDYDEAQVLKERIETLRRQV
eukprot:TRINITY_DN17113_c0_g1_i1.p1 TRINITY_DN17113_c0_g1~~TRINITY_DN17113_c0_g1_i1.p1  ORF type:complete len:1156 (+),score=252.57 TRINITY_DN17113_c0_g1_i1:484-3468(+)